MKKHRGRLAAFVAVVLVPSAVYLLKAAGREPGLRERSVHYRALDGKINFSGYQWHPDGYLVGERYVKGRGQELFRLDPGSGKETVIRPITSKDGYAYDDRGVVSADGKWRIETFEKEFVLVSLTGAKDVCVPNDTVRSNGQPIYENTVAWYPDGTHWVELANESGKTVLLVRSPETPQARQVALGVRDRWLTFAGITPDHHAIVVLTTHGSNSRIASVPLDPDGGPPVISQVHMPRYTSPFRPVLSPNGERILWQGQPPSPSPWVSKLQSLLGRRTNPETEQSTALWISDVKGENWQFIGVERYPRDNTDVLQRVKFTPDGKRASYLFRSEFYTVDLP